MKRLIKFTAIFVLPLLFVAVYFVPQTIFAAGIEADTVLNFIEYTPTPGPTPGPTPTPIPTPDPGVIGGFTAQTGDAVAIAIGVLGMIIAISFAFVMRRHISYNIKSLFVTFCASMLPLALAGTCVAGLNNASARDAGALVSSQIDIYVNTEGGPVHYGEGDRSNVQTYTNTTDNPIFIDEIAMEVTNGGSVDIGKWNASVDGKIIFSGYAGDSQKLADSIYLEPEESFEVTWETEALSEDLLGLIGTAPVRISYKTYESECTVTFETNGGTTIAPAKVTYGDKLTKPADPTKKNNVLKYWASDEALTHEYDFETAVTSNFTLYAYWNASEEYKEEIEEEMAADLKEAKDNVDTIEGLTDAQKEALDEALDDLIDEYNEKIKKAKTQDEVDDLKAEFEDKVLDKEKDALNQSMENREKDVDDKLDDIEGLTETDLNRYKSDITKKKNDAQNKIAAAEDFASAQKQQEKFNGDTDDVYAEAKKLGDAKKAAKATSEVETKKSEVEFTDKYQDLLLPDTLSAFKEKFVAVDADTKEDIDDATTTSEVQEALAKEQKDLKDLFDEAQEILDTKANYEKQSKETMKKGRAEIDALEEVRVQLKEEAQKKMDAEFQNFMESIKNTDDLDELKELKETFDANIQKIVDDIKALDEGITKAKSEINNQAKKISEQLRSRTDINDFDRGNIENELAKDAENIQKSFAKAKNIDELQQYLDEGKTRLESFYQSIVVIQLNFADGQEEMAEYINPEDPSVPITSRAGIAMRVSNVEVAISAEKTRIQKIEDNTEGTYTAINNVFRITFSKSVTTITTTLETVPDEGYAYLTNTTRDNDTLVFTYDGDRSKKPEGTTFDVEDTTVVFGPGWGDYMYGSKTSITKVVIEASFHNVKPKCLAKWFMQSSVEDKQILKEIKGLGNIDTSEVTNFNNTFFGNSSIQKFEGLENWDTGKVTSAESMFMHCKALKDVSNITGWYFASREKFSCPLMFCQCSSLENFAGFNKNHTVSASYTYNMFAGCSMLTSVDILNFNLTSAVSYEMFSGCNNLHNIFYKDDASKSIGESNDMFKDCIALPHFKNNVVDATYAYPNNGLDGYFTDPHPTITLNSFAGGHYEKVGGGEITEIDGDWNVSNVQVRIVIGSATEIMSVKDNAGNNYDLVDNCFTVDFSARYSISVTTTYGYTAKAVYTSEDSTLTFYYDNLTHPGTPIPVPEFTTEAKSPFEQAKNVKTVIFNESFSNFKKITSLKYWFYQFSQLEEVVDIKNLYTDNVVNTYRMFAESGIRHVDLSSNRFYKLSLQSSLDEVFDSCHSLESVIFPDEITENATCARTFKECENLLYVNCGKLKMNQAGLYPAFTGCVRLNTITVNNSWPRNLSQMLAETSPNFSTWHVASSGQDVLSSTIYGNNNGDTYTKLEGYALLTSNNDSNDTLTFKYDHLRSSYQQGHTFDVENTTESNIPWAEYIGGISGSTGTVTTVDFDPSFANVRPKSCASWFKGADGGSSSIVNVNNASNLNTSEATDLSWMFTRCKNMVNPPDTSTWNTSSVTNMTAMFSHCKIVTEIDIRSFTFTSNTITGDPDGTDFGMFNGCSNIEHIYYDKDISNVLTENNSGNMFSGCTNLPHYAEVTDDTLRNNKYAYPNNGQTGYFTSKTPTITLTFAQGSHGHFENPNQPGVAITTFEGTYGAQGVKVKPVADSGYLIDTIVDNNSPQPHTYTIDENGCIELRFDAEYTITATTKAGIEAYAYLSSANATNDTLIFTYDDLRHSRGVNTFDVLDTGAGDPPWALYLAGENPTITTIQINETFKNAQPLSLCFWFRSNRYNPTLTTISGLENIDTSKVTNLNNTFVYSKKLKDISGASNWDVSSVTNLKETFMECSSIEIWPDFTKWELNPSGVGLYYTFAECSKMQKFDGFSNNQKTNLTKNFDYAFYKCSELTYVDLTGFNIVDSTNSAQCMFYECSNLEHIYYNKRLIPSVSSSLFYKCEKLPHYNPSKIDATYAYPNNGQSGYFTSKSPTITLSFAQGSHGHFEDPANPGVVITTFEGTYDAQGVKVKPVVDSGFDIDTIVDNNSPQPHTYTIDENGCIELRFDAEYTITATTKASLQAYAYLTKTTNENDTLVFAYDSEMSSHEPLAWNCENTGNAAPPWGKYVGQGTSSESTVTTVQFTDDFKSCNKVSSCANWFNGWSNTDSQNYSKITTFINTSGTNFTNVTSMAKMFWKANKFETPIDMSGWETSDKLTNLDQMFFDCSSMKIPPDVSVLDTENVTNLSNLFYHCAAMESAPNVSDWNVGNVTRFDSLFYNCANMADAPDTSSWEVSNKATNLIDMFYGCEKMETAPNMSNWDTSRVTDMHGMFSKCESLTEIDITGLDFDSRPCVGALRDDDKLWGMFYRCVNLQNIYCDKDLSNTLNKDTSLFMFYSASKLPHYNEVKEADPNRDCRFAYPDNGTTGYFKMPSIPEAYAAITSSSEESPNDTLIFRYDGDKASYGDLAWNCENTGNVAPPWGKYVGQGTSSESTVTTVQFTKEFKDCDKVQSCYRWFCGLGSNNASQSNITSFVNTENTSFNNVTTMEQMFYSMNSLVTAPNTTGWTTTDKLKRVTFMFANCLEMQTAPDLSSFNMKGAESFYAMFQNCKKMASTPNVEWTMPSAEEVPELNNLSFMFEYCESMVQPPNMTNWNVSNVGDFCRMFYGCKNLNAPPDTLNWDTKGADRFQGMFGMCSSMLTAPDMSNWDTSKATSMSEMFYCSGILKVDISNLTFTSNTNTFRMFYSCKNLFLIFSKDDLSSTLASESSSSMFTDCTSLPHYNYSKTDRTWAFPNDGQAGYFTDPHPTITLNEFTGGHYEDPNSPGQAITQIDDDWDAENVRVKVVVDDQTKKVNTVMDNAYNEYTLDNNEFTVDFSARYSISVTLRDKLGPKAVYDENNETFTFYYNETEYEGDGLIQYDVINTSWSIEEGNGTIAQWQTECSDPTETLNWPTVNDGVNPETIVFDESFKNTTKDAKGNNFTSMAFWFCDMYSVKSVSGLKWVPETVTNISGIFSKFEDTGEASFNDSVLDLTDLKTANVTNVDYFLNGTWFETVTLPSVFAPNATEFSSYILIPTEEGTGIYSLGAFAYMKTATLNIPGTVGGKITNANMMFYGSDRLEILDLPSTKLNLSEVEKTTAMFAYCYNLKSINLTDQAMTSLTTSVQMFRGDYLLQTITVNESWNTLTSLTNSVDMFLDCSALPHYDSSNPIVDKTYAYPDNGTSGYFEASANVAYAALTSTNASNDTLLFKYDSGRSSYTTTYDIPEDGSTPSWVSTFRGSSSTVRTVKIDDSLAHYQPKSCKEWFAGAVMLGSESYITSFEGLDNLNTSACTSFCKTFYNCINVSTISGLDNWDTSLSTRFDYMFSNCKNLATTPYVSGWNVLNSNNFSYMFSGCNNIPTQPDLSNWTSNATTINMQECFNGCSKLTSLNSIEDFNAPNATDWSVKNMFCNCSSLQTVPNLGNLKNFKNTYSVASLFKGCTSITDASCLKDWNMLHVNQMENLFNGCTSLGKVDLSTWQISTSTCYCVAVFANCTSLTVVNLGAFNFNSGTTTGISRDVNSGMFSNCSLLATIYTSKDSSNLLLADKSQNMFYGCTSLPNFDPTFVDCTYAYPSNGVTGYFTNPTNNSILYAYDQFFNSPFDLLLDFFAVVLDVVA